MTRINIFFVKQKKHLIDWNIYGILTKLTWSVDKCIGYMEKSRSWPSAHDWKSCRPQKGLEGSNPSFSAIK